MKNKIDIYLGSSKSGIVLTSTIFDFNNNPVSSGITDGFFEIGGGYYTWSYDLNNSASTVVFFQSGINLPLTFASVSPNIDQYISGQTNNISSSVLYNSGKLDQIYSNLPQGYNTVLDEYISGVVSVINSYSSVYDQYISGQSDKIIILDSYLSGITESINEYNNNLDLYISGKLNNLSVNVSGWRGLQPGNIDSNGFLPANLASINGNTGRVLTLSNAMDNNYIERIFINSNYISGKTDQIYNSIPSGSTEIDKYISGVVQNITSYNNSLDLYISGIVETINSYNDFIDQYISGCIDNIQNGIIYISGHSSYDPSYDIWISGNATYNPSYDIWMSGQAGKNITLYPISTTSNQRIIATNIYFYTIEEKETTLVITDNDGEPVDLTGKQLYLVIEYPGGCDKEIVNGNIIDNKFIFTNPIFYEVSTYNWALRDSGNGNEVLSKGKIYVEDAPYVD